MPALLLSASFTGADNTNLHGWTPEVGAALQALDGTWRINGNRAQLTDVGAGNWAPLVSDCGQADVWARARIAFLAADLAYPAVILRAADDQNYWALYSSSTGNQILLGQVEGDILTDRASAVVALVNGQTYEFGLRAVGPVLTAFLGGAQLFQYTSAFNQAATKHGVGQWFMFGGKSIYFDDLEVRSAVALPTAPNPSATIPAGPTVTASVL